MVHVKCFCFFHFNLRAFYFMYCICIVRDDEIRKGMEDGGGSERCGDESRKGA